jgi:polyisoprenoid-binding protein YceI
MEIETGTYLLGPEAGRILIKTFRTGLGAKIGHDLTIEATRWYCEAVVNVADLSACSAAVSVEVGGLEAREGTGGAKPLTDSDRETINGKLREILAAEHHPTIDFRSSHVSVSNDSFTVDGELSIAGVTRTQEVGGRVDDEHVRGTATIVQTRWGIKPYSAMLGALKLKNDVQVQFDLSLTSGGRRRTGVLRG